MQPPQGPSSASPGPWVPETITNAWMEAKRDPKKLALLPKLPEYKNATTIRDSYRGYVVPIVAGTVDTSTNFSMLGGRGLLSPLDKKEQEEQPKKKKKKENAPATQKRKYISVSNETLDAAYRAWFSDPSYSNRQILFETGHNFLCKKSSFEDDDLRKQGKSDDFQMKFEVRLMRILDWRKARKKEKVAVQPNGEKLLVDVLEVNSPAHYLKGMWNNSRNSALKDLSKKRDKWLSIELPGQDDGEPSDDEKKGAPNHSDFAEFQRWKHGSYEDEEAARAALLQQREGKLATLAVTDPDLADVAGMHLVGMKQRQIAEKKGISQQAVSKKLFKARSILQEVN